MVAAASALQSCTRTAPQSSGYNTDEEGSCGLGAIGDQPATAPDVAISVGSIIGYDLNPGSPLLDAVPIGAQGCGGDVVDDLIGVARPQDGDGDGIAACDIGARERLAVP